MQTSKVILLALAFLASACTLSIPGQSEAPKTAALRGGIVIEGPEGYCVDQGHTLPFTNPNSVVLLSCQRLNGSDMSDLTEGRIFSATALPGRIEDSRQMARALKGPNGPHILSNDQSGQVTVHGTLRTSRALYVELTQEGFPAAVGQRSWKAFVNVKDQIVILSAYKGAGDSMAGETGEKNIRAFVHQIILANRD